MTTQTAVNQWVEPRGRVLTPRSAEEAAGISTTESEPILFNKPAYWASLGFILLTMLYILSVHMTGVAWLPIINVRYESAQFAASLVKCGLGLIAIHLPLVARLFRIKVPKAVYTLLCLIIVCVIP